MISEASRGSNIPHVSVRETVFSQTNLASRQKGNILNEINNVVASRSPNRAYGIPV